MPKAHENAHNFLFFEEPDLLFNAEKREIYMLNSIGLGGNTAEQFVKALGELGDGEITLVINSPGGEVMEGTTIRNLVANHGNVIVRIDGLAASIASVIATGGKHITMQPNAMMMIHRPYNFALGNVDDMLEMASVLEKMGDIILSNYTSRPNAKAQEITDLFNKESWLSAKDALDLGLIDGIIETKTPKNEPQALNKFGYKNVPKVLLDNYDDFTACKKRQINLQKGFETIDTLRKVRL